ncbi:MAG: hypothetical protein ABIQ35_09895 [Verrucomicrobiota bacterium]
MTRNILRFPFFLSILFLTPSIFAQGTLTPVDPPAPTMKTLDQVEARIIVNASNTPGDETNTFIISQPGSYYFTGNITSDSGLHGISIRSDDVTLDLNGYTLRSGGGGAVRGITVSGTRKGFTVRNGNVRGWTAGGVSAESATTLAEKLNLTDNLGSIGLAVGNGSLVKDCVASGNEIGFFGGDRTEFTHCISTVNTDIGFNCGSYTVLLDCTASRNTGNGIVAGGSSSIIRCSATRNNTGIVAGPGCTVAECTVGANVFHGISGGIGSTVRGCTTRGNQVFGITVLGNCQVLDNTSDGNSTGGPSGGGVRAVGTGNRIEGNSCTGTPSGFGISVTGTNNLVIRNSTRGNAPGSNYAIDPGNRYGTIVDLTGNNPNSVSGNSAASTLGTTDPWANFAY